MRWSKSVSQIKAALGKFATDNAIVDELHWFNAADFDSGTVRNSAHCGREGLEALEISKSDCMK